MITVPISILCTLDYKYKYSTVLYGKDRVWPPQQRRSIIHIVSLAHQTRVVFRHTAKRNAGFNKRIVKATRTRGAEADLCSRDTRKGRAQRLTWLTLFRVYFFLAGR